MTERCLVPGSTALDPFKQKKTKKKVLHCTLSKKKYCTVPFQKKKYCTGPFQTKKSTALDPFKKKKVLQWTNFQCPLGTGLGSCKLHKILLNTSWDAAVQVILNSININSCAVQVIV